MRRQFIEAWQKRLQGLPLAPLEAEIAEVVSEHPEYHALLAHPGPALAAEFHPENGQENPFLHMALHLSLREQARMDRPPGVRAALARLASRLGPAEAEHRLLECLGQVLWESQRRGLEPDLQAYQECMLRQLASLPSDSSGRRTE